MYSRSSKRSRADRGSDRRSNRRSNRRSDRRSDRGDPREEQRDPRERDDNDFMIMSSMNDRVMDDRSMNMTRYRKSSDVDRIMLERQMTMDGTDERYGETKRDDHDDRGRPTRRGDGRDDRRGGGRGSGRGSGRGGRRDRRGRRDEYDGYDDGESEFGEITGQRITDESERFDHGMPVRSAFRSRKSEHDQNDHMDFDLFDRDLKPSDKSDRLYYSDDGDGLYSNLEEAMNPITEGTDPYETCITGINTSSCWLNDNMASIMSKSYGISGYAMFSIMGVMYLLSDGETKADYVSYFEFQDKRKLNAGLITIRDRLNKYRDQIIVDNYIVSSYEFDLDRKMASTLKKLAFPVVINPDQPRSESRRINDMVKKISKLPKVFSEKTLSSVDSLSLVSVIKLRPIFQYAITSVVEAPFYSRLGYSSRDNNPRDMHAVRREFVRFVGITCGFFEDRTLRLLEIPLKGHEHCLGIIMRKDNKDDYGMKTLINNDESGSGAIADIKKLSTCINYIEQRVIDEVMVPIIDQRFKVRLNKTLQSTGLKHIFTDPNYHKLYPDGAYISDCIQYMQLTISDASFGERSNNRGYITSCKYIVDTEFEFYIRDNQTNTIFAMGRYNG
jgi:serine protease inhibitor